MNKEVWWKSLDADSLEHLRLTRTDKEITADGLILGVRENAPFRLNYQIFCDDKWRLRKVSIDLQSDAKQRIELSSDGKGNWTDESGENLPEFTGCYDIDISATPFTNTLPIQRTRLSIGESADISVVYFSIPEMTFQRSSQCYLHLKKDLFRFEENGIYKGFSAELQIDEDGLIIDYPQLFKRIKS